MQAYRLNHVNILFRFLIALSHRREFDVPYGVLLTSHRSVALLQGDQPRQTSG